MPPAPDDLHEAFRSLSDAAWLDLLIASLREPEIGGVVMPGFPDETLQREIHGHAGETSLHEAYGFFREVKAYAAYAGQPIEPHRTLLEFGCGWGRILRLFMKDIPSANLFGVDSTPRFLFEARRCNPALAFLSCQPAPSTALAAGTLDYVVSWSVYSHLNEFYATRWIEEFHRLLKPGGLVVLTTQSRRFIQFCADMRVQRASGVRLDHWHGICADSFPDQSLANSLFEAGQFLHSATGQAPDQAALHGEAIIPRGFVTRCWAHLFRLIDFVDDAARLPQALIVLQKPS